MEGNETQGNVCAGQRCGVGSSLECLHPSQATCPTCPSNRWGKLWDTGTSSQGSLLQALELKFVFSAKSFGDQQRRPLEPQSPGPPIYCRFGVLHITFFGTDFVAKTFFELNQAWPSLRFLLVLTFSNVGSHSSTLICLIPHDGRHFPRVPLESPPHLLPLVEGAGGSWRWPHQHSWGPLRVWLFESP